ncbi:MAG: efflux RND transporter periplasmic adaptor subunit, partial [Coriobacteriia bacterium]|nr:efflux RND transporter periplasmic adaptor subunit [Coriobacteriia bacterium]
ASVGDTVVTAPVDGTVIEVGVTIGAMAPVGGAPAIVLADLKHPYIEAALDENDYAQASVGLPVKVLVDALDGITLEGTVTALSAVGNADQNGIVTYALIATLDTAHIAATAGMSVRIDVITQRADDVLIIPTQAVRIEEGRQVVSVLDDRNVARTVPVSLGMTDGTNVEVKSGLSAGQRMALPQEEQ